MAKKRSAKWGVVKRMPPLKHSTPGEDFDIRKSDVMKWVVSQPDILQMVFDGIRGAGDIIYDSDTGTWQGVDYDD